MSPDRSCSASRFDYTYDALGRRTAMATIDGSWTYGYDATGQLTRAIFVPAPGSPVPAQDLRYVYDSLGNRIRTVENGVTMEYTTNTLNQYVRIGEDTLHYDADGNMTLRTALGHSFEYSYDQQGRLTSALGFSGISRYSYSAFGHRVSEEVNGHRTEFLLDVTQSADVVSAFTSSDGNHVRYTHSLGLVALHDSATSTKAFYDYDALGSTAGITESSGLSVNRYAYTPFGAIVHQSDSIANAFTFLGQLGVYTDSNDHYYMRARVFVAELGRFISKDPIGLASGDHNFYRYVGNMPVTHVDPSGLARWYAFMSDGRSEYQYIRMGHGQGWNVHVGKSYRYGTHINIGRTHFYGDGWYHPDFGRSALRLPYTALQRGNALVMWVSSWHAAFEGIEEYTQSLSNEELDNVADAVLAIRHWLYQLVAPLIPMEGGDEGAAGASHSQDPNALYGPAGFGPQNFVRGDTVFPYRIEFENYGPGSVEADGSPAPSSRWATAPAQRVEITNPIPALLVLDTFALTGFGFGDFNVTIPGGVQHFEQVLTMSYNGKTFEVWFEASLIRADRLLRVVFQSLMPGTELPPDVLTGFLPPEDGTGRGKGFVTYTARPLPALPTGTEIRNIALITFDRQTAIATNQVDPLNPSLGTDPMKEALVTIDAGTPNSMVQPLPPTVPSRSFTVSWSGSDDVGGSGIGRFDIYVSTDGGPYEAWLMGTELLEAEFRGEHGRSYAFYSIATDNVGHSEQPPTSPDAVTNVADALPALTGFVLNDGGVQRSMVTSITVSFNRPVTFTAGAFTVKGINGAVNFLMVPIGNDSETFRISFAVQGNVGGSISDGHFRLLLDGSRFTDSLGRPLAATTTQRSFHRLFGDLDGDTDVDTLDLAKFHPALGSHSGDPGYQWFMDYDSDGDVDQLDWGQVRSRLGKKLGPGWLVPIEPL